MNIHTNKPPRFPIMEMALSAATLADTVKAKMSDLALNGDEATNPQEPNGFYDENHRLRLRRPPWRHLKTFAGSHASAVDGIHAQNEKEVSSRDWRFQSYQLGGENLPDGRRKPMKVQARHSCADPPDASLRLMFRCPQA